MRDMEQMRPSFRGQFLLAHPALTDAHFRRAVILISDHNEEEGAMGLVWNRPLEKTLVSEFTRFAGSGLEDVPLYEGGPVQENTLLLVAWEWQADGGGFKLHFGIPVDDLIALKAKQPGLLVRAFKGYSGWTEGQLEGELAENAWLVASVSQEFLDHMNGTADWQQLVAAVRPELSFLAQAPDDPSVN